MITSGYTRLIAHTESTLGQFHSSTTHATAVYLSKVCAKETAWNELKGKRLEVERGRSAKKVIRTLYSRQAMRTFFSPSKSCLQQKKSTNSWGNSQIQLIRSLSTDWPVRGLRIFIPILYKTSQRTRWTHTARSFVWWFLGWSLSLCHTDSTDTDVDLKSVLRLTDEHLLDREMHTKKHILRKN